MSNGQAIATLSAQDTYTDWVSIKGGFNLFISGTWLGTITLQRRKDGGTPMDVNSWTTNQGGLHDIEYGTNVEYRSGFKTSEYTSGSAVVEISQ